MKNDILTAALLTACISGCMVDSNSPSEESQGDGAISLEADSGPSEQACEEIRETVLTVVEDMYQIVSRGDTCDDCEVISAGILNQVNKANVTDIYESEEGSVQCFRIPLPVPELNCFSKIDAGQTGEGQSFLRLTDRTLTAGVCEADGPCINSFFFTDGGTLCGNIPDTAYELLGLVQQDLQRD
jgi:hypothetical protein